jgi:DNA-binding response OmpR family regulator
MSGSTILVVDDTPGTRLVFSSWLRRAGYTVHEADNGSTATELLARISFDIALLDVHLPDMSGLDICEQIKSSRATSSVPVLMISATAVETDDRSAGLNRGADAYLVEPVQRDELLATVGALLRYHEARRTAERLATRLERLHEGTLLMNAASTVADLTQLAADGLLTLLGRSVLVAVARDTVGLFASTSSTHVETTLTRCKASDVIELAERAQDRQPLVGTAIARRVNQLWDSATGSPVATPRGELVGVIVLFEAAPSPEDSLIVDAYAAAFAVALENRRLYAIEHQIGVVLQRAMLPRTIPQSPRLEVAVRYHAASEAAEVGGDFYDAVRRDENTTLLVIGDVAGHSLVAATVMAELRYSFRAFATLGLPPAEIVHHLSVMFRDSHPTLTATLCLAEIDTSAGVARLCNAGHVPPVVRYGDRIEVINEHGPLLGLGPSSEPPITTIEFGTDALLVLVTDGLLERRGEDLHVGVERLRESVLRHEPDPATLCDHLVHDVSDVGQVFDDIAIVIARHLPAGS